MLLVGVLATMALAAPLDEAKATPAITEYRNEPDGLGGYRFSYRTSDGTYREETGELKNPGTDQEYMEVRGLTIWKAPDGQEYMLSFVANQDGYVAQGDHLPRGPKQPPTIRRKKPQIQRIQGSTLISLLRK